MFSRIVLTLFSFNFLLPSIFAERFLFITTNIGHSHLGFSGRCADVLVDEGHEVDFIIPLINNFVKTNGSKKANVTRLRLDVTDKLDRQMREMKWWNDVFESEASPDEGNKLNSMFGDYCESILRKPDYLDYLRSRNYSIGMAETFDACSFSLFHLLGIKNTHKLSALPLMLHDQVSYGVPLDISIPEAFDQNQITPIESLYERARNWYKYLSFRWNHLKPLPVDKVMQREVSASYPSVTELMKQADNVWLNTNEFIDFPRALPAKIKHIGGVGIGQPQEMNEYFKAIFDRATKGVILVSFGSIVDTTHMKPRIRDAFLDAFAQFPDYEFIWKVSDVNGNNLSSLASTRYPNVHPVNWMNQPSILAHPRTSAFITHLGLNSLNEAALYGVPMVALPFFGDQQYNTAALLNRGLGVYVNRRQVTAEKLSNAIRTVLEDPSYRTVAKEVSQKMNNVPFDSREVFVRSVEFSARHGPVNESKLPPSKTNLIQKHLLDVFAVTIFALFAVIYTVILMLRWTIRLLNRFIERFGEQQKKKV